VLLESLCRQTEKLEDSRTKVDTLQELLLHHDQVECCTEREQKLVELLKVLLVQIQTCIPSETALYFSRFHTLWWTFIHTQVTLVLSRVYVTKI
jgi:hypothetical protein